MSYQEAVEFLYQLQKFGAKPGLERAFKLAELAGRPQDKLKFIHVAGTNGKGSTCAMLESIYRHAGYKTGLFTSPHLISFAERIQVNRQLIPEPEVARLVSEMRNLLSMSPMKMPVAEVADFLKEPPEIDHPTFFEVVTIMALIWFAEQKCDIVIWETGLGGRLDATNIVTPLASVITSINFDHEKWLGHTITEIAREKAGIIKPGVPVFTLADSQETWNVIRETAQRNNAPIHTIERKYMWPSSLIGPHQLDNSGLAVMVAKTVPPAIDDATIRTALQKVIWPGRFDVRGRYIFDGAHNREGALMLFGTIALTFPKLRPAFIVGILADKDIAGMADAITRIASRVLTVPVHSDRAADANVLADIFQKVGPNVPVEVCASLAQALAKTENDERVVITGSLHFIGEAMEHLGFEVGKAGERSLNDWSQKGNR